MDVSVPLPSSHPITMGDLRSAEKVFDEMTERDVMANNVMLLGFSKHGFVEEAQRLFDSMQYKSKILVLGIQ
ncbi:hypothetical protein C3L33_23119, partial [Rhododendron williamsianum]